MVNIPWIYQFTYRRSSSKHPGRLFNFATLKGGWLFEGGRLFQFASFSTDEDIFFLEDNETKDKESISL